MASLVAYGSDSDSDNDDSGNVTEVQNKLKPEVPQDFFDDVPQDQTNAIQDNDEVELEDIVKPKDWEKKLAKRAKKELDKLTSKEKKKKEKKSKKDKEDKPKKEKKKKDKKDKVEDHIKVVPKVKEKAKISAFGALKALDGDASDSEDRTDPIPTKSISLNKAPSGLLSMLPKPKVNQKANLGGLNACPASTSLIPASVRQKSDLNVQKNNYSHSPSLSLGVSQTNLKRKAEEDDSDDDEPTDFFGLSTQPESKLFKKHDDVPLVGTSGLESNIGPARPTQNDQFPDEEEYPVYEDMETTKVISNEQAVKLLSRDETIQFMERRSLTDIASNLLEVRVDDALGPNVKQNLLKSITKKAIVKDTMAPLPKTKGPVDPNARKKNQITYLANLAVDREEALQEQWSESKQMKRMTRQKYGF